MSYSNIPLEITPELDNLAHTLIKLNPDQTYHSILRYLMMSVLYQTAKETDMARYELVKTVKSLKHLKVYEY